MSVTAAAGFEAAGVEAGLKASGGLDVALVVNDQNVTHYGSPVLVFRWGQQGGA